ncbi:hypothetical protein [Parapedobacter soli]|uniref:hypothetical protein n=1 Tax=Parapedobacter soli TaxID=416955 RepID=UPI0021CA2E75|nr:hypothetical protein [Parapedobacter soli]
MTMKFEIEYTGHITIEAKDKYDADRIFAEHHQNLGDPKSYTEIETSDEVNIVGQSYEVIGYCEISGKSIFEGDDFGFDDEGVMWLKSEEDKPITNPKIAK